MIKTVFLRAATYILLFFVAVAAVYGLFSFIIRPSNDRDWALDQAVLPYAEIRGEKVTIYNIRNFAYASTTSYTPAYYDKTFTVPELRRVWYVVEPFAKYKGAAHTFVSFEFENNEFVSVSVEIRKEKGESFSALKGLLRQYELMYVIADERDVIKLRSNYRHDQVFVYPIKTTPEKAQTMFLDMLSRTNTLRESPEFYNTIWNTCTTNIVSHVNKITPGKVPFSFRILMPADSDELAYEIGMIDTDLSFPDARAEFNINERALRYAEDLNFSVRIRETN